MSAPHSPQTKSKARVVLRGVFGMIWLTLVFAVKNAGTRNVVSVSEFGLVAVGWNVIHYF